MAILNDETTTTHSSLGSGATVADADAPTLNTSDNGEDVSVFVDNGSGGAPADFTLITERYSPAEDRWMEYGRSSVSSASQPQSFDDPAIPSEMRFKVKNDSAGAATYRVDAVSF